MRKADLMRLFVAGALLASMAARAGASGIGGPASGFILDGRSQAIRPINGLPGASLLGSPLAVPFRIGQAAIARDFALASRAEDGALFVVSGLRDAVPSVAPFDGAIPDVSLFSLSASGNAAVIYSAVTARIQIVTGLPGKPVAAPAVDVSPLPGAITAIEVNDGGSGVVAGVRDGAGNAVYGLLSFSGDSGPKYLGRAQDLSALALLRDGADAAFADRFANQVFLVRDIAGNAEVSILAGEQDGIDTPVALEAVNAELYIADAGSGSLTVVDLVNRGAPASIALPGSPTRCERLGGEPILVLNEAGSAPLLLLDLTQGRNLFFVPADRTF